MNQAFAVRETVAPLSVPEKRRDSRMRTQPRREMRTRLPFTANFSSNLKLSCRYFFLKCGACTLGPLRLPESVANQFAYARPSARMASCGALLVNFCHPRVLRTFHSIQLPEQSALVGARQRRVKSARCVLLLPLGKDSVISKARHATGSSEVALLRFVRVKSDFMDAQHGLKGLICSGLRCINQQSEPDSYCMIKRTSFA
jgi:hypothetical protein